MEKTLPKDGIVEAIVNSGRLTFDDETVIRHHIATSLSKPSSNLLPLSLGLTVASGTIAGLILLSRQHTAWAKASLSGAASSLFAIAVLNALKRSLRQQVQQLLAVLHDSTALSHKINRWILDNEVLQRGYTVATTGLTNAQGGKEKGTELTRTHACFRLRRAAFVQFRFMVFVLRAVAFDLLNDAIDSKDSSSEHICAIPLEEFGDCFSISENESEALRFSTDGFSLQAIKSLTGLMDLQASELLKLLCTLLLAKCSFGDEWVLHKRLKTANNLLAECHRRLQAEYAFETENGSDVAKKRSQSSRAAVGPPDNIRSLELHLTAALKDVRMVGMGDEAGDELERVARDDRMEKLGYHVKCATLLLDHLKRKSLQVNDQTLSSAEAKLSPTESDFEIPSIGRSEDAVLIQDEIFEALVMDDVEAEQRGEPVFDVLYHFEEQKQQSRMVLEEIKSLLDVRSADWRQRERRARQRQGLPLMNDDQDEQKVPSTSLPDPTEFQASLDEVFGRGDGSGGLVSQMDIASSAASLGSLWARKGEDQFGEDDSQLSDNDSGSL